MGISQVSVGEAAEEEGEWPLSSVQELGQFSHGVML
jgi:hypothetical protein